MDDRSSARERGRTLPQGGGRYRGRVAWTTVSSASLGPFSVSTTRTACCASTTVRPASTAASVTSLTW